MSAAARLPDAPGWAELGSPEGAALLAEFAECAPHERDALARRARSHGVDPALLAAALTQLDLRVRAREKFGALADRLLLTRAGLEQATRAPVAELHAARFAGAGIDDVADLGCGIGAESLALLAAGVTPRPVELDPLTASFAEHNLDVLADRLGVTTPVVRVDDAESIGAGDAGGVFLDPARRTAGHRDTRRVSPDEYSPSLRFAFEQTLPTGVKLGPALDHDLIPDRAEAQWVSVAGQLVETALWFGAVARTGVRRSALVIRGDSHAELSSPDGIDAARAVELRGIGEFLYEPDPAIIRARLIGDLATRLGAGTVGEGIAYLTGDSSASTPFAQRFRVLERVPVREKALRSALASRDIGALEIKKRGVNVEPSALRKALKLKGSESATLVLTRELGAHVGLLVERC